MNPPPQNYGRRIVIDFETRCELDIRRTSAYKYARHRSCDIICMGFKFDDDPQVYLWWPRWVKNIVGEWPDGNARQRLVDCLALGAQLEAHNAEFEQAIWNNVLTRYGFPRTDPVQWDCTAARARTMGLPGALGKVAAALNLRSQKDDKGHQVMLRLCKPKKPSGKDPGIWDNTPEKFWAVFQYCRIDVATEAELGDYLLPLQPSERRLWLLDQAINARGVPVDLTLCAGALQVSDNAKEQLHTRFEEITGIDKATKRAKLNAWLLEHLWSALEALSPIGYMLAEGWQEWPVEKRLALHPRGVYQEVKKVKGKDEKEWRPNIPETPPPWMPPDNYQAETLRDWLVDYSHAAPAYVVEALEVYGLANKRATDKFNAFMRYTQEDGRARGLLVFHGASTGRWTSGGVQLQNIKRGDLKKGNYGWACEIVVSGSYDVLRMFFEGLRRGDKKPLRAYDVLGSCARGAIRATPGHKLVWADFASIEARTLFWLAGEEGGLALYRAGADIYIEMASTIYGMPVASIGKESRERWVGKQTVLGCGYQMGWERFIKQCKKYGEKVPEDLARASIDAFRGRFAAVPKLWYDLNAAAILAVQNPLQQPTVRGITFAMAGPEWLSVRLPSGRLLWYFQPKVGPKKSKWGTTKIQLSYMGWDSERHRLAREWTYGGKICENIVQAIARDCMSYHLHLTTEHGWCIITHTHDEVVCEEPENGRGSAELAHLMSQAPPWAQGLPVVAEGKEGNRYRK